MRMSYVRSRSSSREMPRQNAGRSMKRSSGSPCTMWRTPRNFGWPANRSNCSAASSACRSIQPITPATNGCASASVEQPSRFVKGLARLHRHAGIDSRAIHFAAQIGRQKIPAQRGHRVVYPSVLGGTVVPEMLMGIYSHDRAWPDLADLYVFRIRFSFQISGTEFRPPRSTDSTLRRAPSS